MPVNIDYEWFLLAMVVIAFIRWAIDRLAQKGIVKPADDEEDDMAEDEDLVRRREEALARQRGEAPPLPPPGDGIDPNEQIRRFFEALGGQTQTKAPPPVERDRESAGDRADLRRAQVPPPLPPPDKPVRQAKPVSQALTKEERAALARIKAQDTAYDTRQGTAYDTREGTASPLANVELQTLLRQRGGLRNAVLLREILGPPRGLQSTEESHTF